MAANRPSSDAVNRCTLTIEEIEDHRAWCANLGSVYAEAVCNAAAASLPSEKSVRDALDDVIELIYEIVKAPKDAPYGDLPGYVRDALPSASETLWGALGDLAREAEKHIKPGMDGYAHLHFAQQLLFEDAARRVASSSAKEQR